MVKTFGDQLGVVQEDGRWCVHSGGVELIRILSVLFLCLVAMGCESDNNNSSPNSSPDAMAEELDAQVAVEADIGTNCVLVRDEEGEWVPECVEPDLALPQDMGIESQVTISLLSPTQGQVFAEEAPISITGVVIADNLPLEFVAMELLVPGRDISAIAFDRRSGQFSADIGGLPPGQHDIAVVARAAPDIEVTSSVSITVECGFFTDFSSTLDPNMWKVLGSASLDDGGWLEMSNSQTSTSGGIFLVGRTITPGALNVSFRISSGSSQC